jgi:hypothetical protein
MITNTDLEITGCVSIGTITGLNTLMNTADASATHLGSSAYRAGVTVIGGGCNVSGTVFSGTTGRLITDNGITVGNIPSQLVTSGGMTSGSIILHKCQAEENDNLVGDLLKRAFIADRAYATLALQMCARLPNVISQIIVDQAYVDPRVIDLIMNTLSEADISTSLPDNHGSIWSISPYVKICGMPCGSVSHVSIVVCRNGRFSWHTLGLQNIFNDDADLSDGCAITLGNPYDPPMKAGAIDPKLVAALRHKLHQLL